MTFTIMKRKYMLEIALNSSIKAAVIIDELDDMFLRTKLGDSFNLLPENFAHEARALMVYKSHMIYPCFKAKHDQLIESGFVSHWKQAFDVNVPKKVNGPLVLTMEHLKAGFLVWVYSIMLSVVVFVLELIHSNYLKLLQLIRLPLRSVIFENIIVQWLNLMRGTS